MEHSFFEVIFPEIAFNYSGDTQICCPFPHKVNNVEYFEENPSAGINISKGVFHCFSCNRAFSEIGFAAEYLKVPYDIAAQIVNLIHTSEGMDTWQYAVKSLWENEAPMRTLLELGFSKKAALDLQIGYKGQGIIFPIIMFGRLLDEVVYRPGQTPKYLRRNSSTSGLIYGYDLWKKSNKATIICAGEKDATIARTLGLNAISFTGGEQSVSTLFLNEFKDKKVYIVYDNDEAGRNGSNKLAMHLKPIASEVYVVDISPVCKEKGEDLWDFFMKYKKTITDFVEILRQSKLFTEEDYKVEKNKAYPIVSLHDATMGKNVGKLLRSNVQVVATIDTIFSLPIMITSHKYKVSANEEKNLLPLDHRNSWVLSDRNVKDMFYMIDSGLKENKIEQHIRTNLLNIPPKEDHVSIKVESKKSVYKSIVSDLSNANDTSPLTEFIAYSIDYKLETGKKYLITYKLVPHPQDGQKLMMVVNDVEESDDFLTSFQITPDRIEHLKKFQVPPQMKLEDKFNDTIQRVKGILNADYNEQLIAFIDLWYHSVLEFNVGKFKNIRGIIDALIVAESRVGKSSTVEALQKTYNLGKVIPLNNATIAGLIGGSNKVAGSYQTRAGIIPQNHKGALIFEELSKAAPNIMGALTDFRSSGKVRITRVNGNIELPAVVRMLTLSNAKTIGGMSKPISSYPNGISVLLDLVGTAEDIARYDMIAIFGFNADKPIDPFFEPLEPYSDEEYQTRIRWVWSRKPDQIIISKEIYEYTLKHANILNKTYNSYIKIFGVEAWKKIMRLAIAIAGYVCSTDETFENIVVKTSHIDLAVKLLVGLYDNPVFRFKQFVEEENKLKEIDLAGISILQELYETNPTLMTYLANCSESTRSNLSTISGMDNEAFGKLMHAMVANLFVRVEGFSITPTERFRKGMTKINTDIKVPKAKEVTIKFD